jgi:hypothetical protein
MLARILLVCSAALIWSTTAEARGGGGGHGGHSGGSHSIRGHVTKKGTYVAPAHATNPNATKVDNWSTKNNSNPYTGKAGTKDPF